MSNGWTWGDNILGGKNELASIKDAGLADKAVDYIYYARAFEGEAIVTRYKDRSWAYFGKALSVDDLYEENKPNVVLEPLGEADVISK